MITVRRVTKAGGKHLSRFGIALRYWLGSKRSRYCPACHHDVSGFYRYGSEREWGCPHCGASPRERLMHALLDLDVITIPRKAAVLHCAPNEMSLVHRFRLAAGDYVPVDFDPSRYPLPDIRQLDLMTLDDEARFDIIYASHVMEHVPDDAQALRNIAHALKPGGEAWLIVPLWEKATEDGSADLSPRQRERRFGQWDHVRQYGRDLADRIRAAGLAVDMIDTSDIPAEMVHHMALGDTLFRARRSD